MFYKINYIAKDSICGEDFNNPAKTEMINVSLISSLSVVKPFSLPFSGTIKGKYALLTMNNLVGYYITEDSFSKLSQVIITER